MEGATTNVSFDTLFLYADKTLWLGASSTLFPIIDFLKRAPGPDSAKICSNLISFLISLSVLIALSLATLLGLVLTADDQEIARLSDAYSVPYAIVLCFAFVLSLGYALTAELFLWTR